MRALVTGAYGFIGRHLVLALRAAGLAVDPYGRGDDAELLMQYCRTADIVYHMAGVNRALDGVDFVVGNVDSTRALTDALQDVGNRCPVVYASSVQADTEAGWDTPYSRTKRQAEELLLQYAKESGAPVAVLRLPGVFGKWCRPRYNSVVGTFCEEAAYGRPLPVVSPQHELELLYIDDLTDMLLTYAAGMPVPTGIAPLPAPYHIRVGELAARIQDFAAMQRMAAVPQMTPRSLDARLYATYLSYLPPEELCLALPSHCDERGSFCELLRSHAGGQLSVSVTLPGQERGGHWHGSKWEIFYAVSGSGEVRLQRLGSAELLRFPLSGENPSAVRIPPGYVHRLINTDAVQPLVTVIWAGEHFDEQHPDTYREEEI
jgi:UDP-2-acetamido-2,6-beta-L-arabino-hexul-4-ose reductase